MRASAQTSLGLLPVGYQYASASFSGAERLLVVKVVTTSLMASLLERAEELAGVRPAEAAALYRQAALEDGTDAEALKVKETSVTKLAELLVRSASHSPRHMGEWT